MNRGSIFQLNYLGSCRYTPLNPGRLVDCDGRLLTIHLMKLTNICFLFFFQQRTSKTEALQLPSAIHLIVGQAFLFQKFKLDWVDQSEIEKKTLAKPKSLNFLIIENINFLKIS